MQSRWCLFDPPFSQQGVGIPATSSSSSSHSRRRPQTAARNWTDGGVCVQQLQMGVRYQRMDDGCFKAHMRGRYRCSLPRRTLGLASHRPKWTTIKWAGLRDPQRCLRSSSGIPTTSLDRHRRCSQQRIRSHSGGRRCRHRPARR